MALIGALRAGSQHAPESVASLLRLSCCSSLQQGSGTWEVARLSARPLLDALGHRALHISPAPGSSPSNEDAQPSSGSGGQQSGAAPPAPRSLSEALQAVNAQIQSGQISSGLPWDPTKAAQDVGEAPVEPAGPDLPSLDDLDAPQASGPPLGAPTPPGSSAAASGSGRSGGQLVSDRYGYAALGGVDPAAATAASAPGGDLLSAITGPRPRLHPRRTFLPGQTYESADLNPYAPPSPRRAWRAAAELRPRPAEVAQLADYKNVMFLASKFLSPAGRLLPRRQTRLPVTLHRMACRQIKLARNLGLMAGEARLDKLQLSRLREQEMREMQAARQPHGAPRNELLEL